MLEEGKVIEQGTHADLLKQNGFYAEMYARQQQQEGDKSIFELI